MESSAPSGKSTTEPPPQSRWGELFGSAIAILTLILPVAAIVHYSPVSSVQALPNLPPNGLPSVATIETTE
jgi:Ca2+/Na+ antiporter